MAGINRQTIKNQAMELPNYLQKIIFDEFKGFFKNGENVEENLSNDNKQNRRYLGTYFPRSYAESYNLFNNVFSNEDVLNTLIQKDQINILDIGSGTGGELIGLLHALKAHGLDDKDIYLHTIEGNEDAISYYIQLIHASAKFLNLNIKCFPKQLILGKQEMIATQLDYEFSDGIKYDIILSFKFISELYNRDYNNYKGTYSLFADTLSNYLADEGLLILQDVTASNLKRSRPYTSIIMNSELGEYIKSDKSDLSFLAPLSCALWGCSCKTKICFTQILTHVSHRSKHNDKAKSTYKIMAKNTFANKVLAGIKISGEYQVIYGTNSNNKKCSNGNLLSINVDNCNNSFDISTQNIKNQ